MRSPPVTVLSPPAVPRADGADQDPGAATPRAVPGRRWLLAPALVVLAALAARLVVVLLQPVVLLNDSADYQRLAVSLATGHGWGPSHFAAGGGPTALRPPLYPLFLATIYKLVGVHLLAARLAGATLGALAVLLLMAAVEPVWGRTAALLSGVLAAVLPPLVLASTSLMSEALAVPLELAAFAALLRSRHHPPLRVPALAAAGVLFGLLVLTRPSLAVLGLPVALLAAGPGPGLRRLARPALLLALALVVVTPWELRDRVVTGHWIPLTTQGGYVLAGTYNASSATDPRNPAAWRPATLDPAVARLLAQHPRAGEPATNALLESSALRYLAGHPAYPFEVAYENSRRLLDLAPLSFTRSATTSEYGVPAAWGDAEAAGGLLLLALALAGLATPRGRRGVPLAWWAAPVLLWAATVVLQAVPRFRAVIDPFLLPLAAVALLEGARRLRRGAAGP